MSKGIPMAEACASKTSLLKPCDLDLMPSSLMMVSRKAGFAPDRQARCSARHESLPPLHEVKKRVFFRGA
jgi:hypothetical protein